MICAWLAASCGFISNSELRDRLDADNDGLVRADDCDDNDPTVTTYWFYLDLDQDDYGDPDQAMVEACEVRTGLAIKADDCDDRRPDVNPGVDESCNQRDDNCDGMADNDVSDPFVFFQDFDGDGYGDAEDSVETCVAPEGYVEDNTDCDDKDADTRGRRIWYVDSDNDGWGDERDTQLACEQPDGMVGRGGDCDDTRSDVHPEADEVCSPDPVDEDCDGLVDDDDVDNLDPSDGLRFFFDDDRDGRGDPLESSMRCAGSGEWVGNRNDCDDSDPRDEVCQRYVAISAGATATCLVKGDARIDCWGEAIVADPDSIPEGIFVDVAVGQKHACALSQDGALACWGNNENGNQYQSDDPLVEVRAGGEYTCGLARIPNMGLEDSGDDGYTMFENDLQCWAFGGEYRLGVAGRSFVAFDVGSSHSCGLLNDRNVRCIGACDSGECRPGAGPWVGIAAGREFSCGIHSNAGVRCWGDVAEEEIPGDFDEIVAYGWNVCASMNGERPVCWTSLRTEIALEPPDTRFQLWDVGGTHGCGIEQSTNAILCWGGNLYGQSTPPY
ncbi:MAG: hypothetical protein CL927_00660 [Deltaproteobacteria bacterium]|nr:hypothetical protein [Deltaproteobacteria bacterium]